MHLSAKSHYLAWALLMLLANTCSGVVVVSVAGTGNGIPVGDDLGFISYDSGPVGDSQAASISANDSALGASSSAEAYANLVPGLLDPGLHLRSSARALADAQSLVTNNAWAVAQWGDTIRISEGSRSDDHLAVTFTIRGDYGYTIDGLHEVDMVVGMANISAWTPETSDPQAYRWSQNLSFFPRIIDSEDPLITETSMLALRRDAFYGARTLEIPTTGENFYSNEPSIAPAGSPVSGEGITGKFGWQEVFFIPYSQESGGYNLNMFAFAGSEAWSNGNNSISSMVIDAWNTFTLDKVTYADGSPIVGSISFDSGFSLPTVPEPASISMALLAGLGFLTTRSRRRKPNLDVSGIASRPTCSTPRKQLALVASLCVLVGIASDAQATTLNTATLQFHGSVSESPHVYVPTVPPNFDFISFDKTSQDPLGEVSIGEFLSASVGLAEVTIGGDASSNIGILKATITGFMNARSASDHALYSLSNGRVDGRARASWHDVATVEGPVPGTVIKLNAVMALEGSLTSTANSTGSNTANASAIVSFSGTGISSVSGGAYKRRYPFFTENNSAPLELIPVNIVMIVGSPYAIDYILETRGVAEVTADLTDPPGFSTTEFESAFSDTARWGGITSVTDALTGEVLTNWTIGSESGFDYSRPAQIPEPSTSFLAMLAIAFWGWSRNVSPF